MKDQSNIVMLYIEPTPYILGLIERLRERSDGEVRVLFIGSNLTQQWGLDVENEQTEVLPSNQRKAKQRIRALLKTGNYQAVHLAGWGHPLLFSTLIYARMKRIPSLVESDTPRPPYITRWKAILKKIAYPVVFRAPAMFLPGGSRQAEYIRDFGVSEKRITIAQMTVDTVSVSAHVDSLNSDDRIRIRQRFGIPPNAVVFLYVGRMEPHKGIRLLLQAFEQLRQLHSNAYLLLVGDGTLFEELKDASQALVGLVVAGRLSGGELLDSYAASDIFVLPSLFEPWGLVVNEALAAGLCVIATDRVGCSDDLVMPGKTGLVVAADSESVLRDAMQTLMQDSDLRESMKLRGRELIANWSLEAEADIVVASWRSVLCN